MQEGPVLRNRVKELRARLDMRQADLAKEIGVTRQTVLAIEKGRLNPSVHIALRAARVLREPVDYVFFLDYSQGEEDVAVAAHSAKNGGRQESSDSEESKPQIWDLAGSTPSKATR